MGLTKRTIIATLAPLLVCVAACTDPPRKDILGTEKKLYSQADEELLIRDFFQDRRDGFFLDIGCAWARRNSTTYYLEHHLDWSGIGVDALDEYAAGWAELRPKNKFLNFLVTDHADTVDPFFRAAWPGVSSAKKEQVEKMKIDYKEIQVQTITIDKLLELNQVSKVDFLSMDIEGAQMQALAGFDIEKYQPELICMEAYPPDEAEIMLYFNEHGYELIEAYREHDQVNWYFTPRG